MKTMKSVSALGLLVAIGIVFGDIGTSPLYVMKTILSLSHDTDTEFIIGTVSCVIWTLTLQTTLKYVIIALRADNKGEGGILALYALIKRHSRKWLYIIAALGASTLIADGIITPAITVTTAIEGLDTINPDTPTIPIVLTIIALIFIMQRVGTGSIGKFFGPFMLLWFLMLGVLGILSIHLYPGIMKAFNPWWAIKVLITYPGSLLIVGAVFLCTTGAEALYSDLGHCGRLNISISWLFVKMMLIINYLGQGAWIIASATSLSPTVNPFFAIMPHEMLIPGIIMSTGAAIIASQALISGSFTLFSEAIGQNFIPALKIKYPSSQKGQLYIPVINTFLFVGCIVTVLLFRTSSHMEAAYGLSITITMLMTTVLLAFYMHRKGLHWTLSVGFFIVFGVIEGGFFIANMMKFAQGGWYTIAIASVLLSIMMVWYHASALRRKYVETRYFPDYYGIISDIKSDKDISKYASNVVYVSTSPSENEIESKLIYSIINKHPKRADHYWIIRFNHVDDPFTLNYTSRILIPDTLYSIKINIGFRVQPQINVYLRQIVEDLVAAGKLNLTSSFPSLRKYDIPGDFKFIIIHRRFSPSSNCSGRDRTILSLYEKIRRLGISHEEALGLDTSTVDVETVPLIINHNPSRRITPLPLD